MYNSPSDPPGNGEGSHNAWAVLSNTEKWISNTLQAANTGAVGANNPYARKEVSYVCENQSLGSMIVAGIFRRLKDAREQGEAHGDAEIERSETQGSSLRAFGLFMFQKVDFSLTIATTPFPSFLYFESGESYNPSTMRQTQVVVIPSNPSFSESFTVFDELVETINQARRNARDYITDTDEDEDNRSWSVAINCAHLHPTFGERSPAQQLQDMKDEDEAGEVDVNLEQYKKMRLQARRSPYPTVVIEVRAQPTPDFSESPAPSTKQQHSDESGVSAADIQKLEALFGKQAAINSKDSESSFWDAVGNSIEEVAAVTPLKLGEQWIASHANPPTAAAFTETGTPHVDAAYEFVFTNLAMLQESSVEKQYLVMPNFLSAAATSFEKFATQVHKISSTLPDLGVVTVDTFHPEHIDPAKRSPMPILSLSLSN